VFFPVPPEINIDHLQLLPESAPVMALRSIRAGDAPLSVWASLRPFAAAVQGKGDNYLLVSNGFGGIDLGFFLESIIREHEDQSVSLSFADVSGRQGRSRWVPPVGKFDTIFFCDDSISSGITLNNFRHEASRRFPNAQLEAFVLFLDFNSLPRIPETQITQFRRWARFATGRAPWSESGTPKPSQVTSVAELIQDLLASSDEVLRWIATDNVSLIEMLNATR
jgi:hypothetical protein